MEDNMKRGLMAAVLKKAVVGAVLGLVVLAGGFLSGCDDGGFTERLVWTSGTGPSDGGRNPFIDPAAPVDDPVAAPADELEGTRNAPVVRPETAKEGKTKPSQDESGAGRRLHAVANHADQQGETTGKVRKVSRSDGEDNRNAAAQSEDTAETSEDAQSIDKGAMATTASEDSVGDDGGVLLQSAKIRVKFEEIDDVNQPAKYWPTTVKTNGNKHSWVCVLLYKHDPGILTSKELKSCDETHYKKTYIDECYVDAMTILDAADGYSCYEVENCSNEQEPTNELTGIENCNNPRNIKVKDSQIKVDEIKYARLFAHDVEKEYQAVDPAERDFDFVIDDIELISNSSGNAHYIQWSPLKGEVDHAFDDWPLDLGYSK